MLALQGSSAAIAYLIVACTLALYTVDMLGPCTESVGNCQIRRKSRANL